MVELNQGQLFILENLSAHGFRIVAFPLYASHIGVRRGNCATLLIAKGERLEVFGDISYLVEGNLGVRMKRKNRDVFVFKKKELEATPERLAEINAFRVELETLLRRPT